MDPLTPEARSLLAAYREARPGRSRRAGNLAAVRRTIRATRTRWLWVAGLSSALAAAALLLAHAMFVGWQAVAVAPASPTEAVAGSEVAGGEVAVRSEVTAIHRAVPAEPPASTPAPAAPESAAREPAAHGPVVPESTAPRVRRIELPPPPSAPQPGAPQPGAADPATERRLVATIRDAIAAGDDAAALVAIGSLEQESPGGVYAEERRAYEAVARCRLADPRAAEVRRSFTERHPRSHHHAMIRGACESSTSGGAR